MSEFASAVFLEAWYQSDRKHGAFAGRDRWSFLTARMAEGFTSSCALAAVLFELAHLQAASKPPAFKRTRKALLAAAENPLGGPIEDYVRTSGRDGMRWGWPET